MKQIIDISTFDRTVDFEKLKAAGIAGVIIRAGYGPCEIDEYFREHAKCANAAGLPAGIYWFSYAYTVGMARAEAKSCLDTIRPYKVELPVFWDWEYASDGYAKTKGVTVHRALLNTMAEAFCDTIQEAGYKAGIYFNKDFRINRFYKLTLDKYVQWYAYYNSRLDDATGIDLWQYTSNAEVDGVPAAKEDMNYLLNESLLPPDKPKEDLQAEQTKALQKALNASYGLSLAVDGYCGPKTLAAIRAHYLRYTVPVIKNEHVKWLQAVLVLLGYDLAVDGSFGPMTSKAVVQFQKDKMLTVDGLAGPATHQMILANME